MELRSHRDLKVWQLGMRLVKEVYRLSQKWPNAERYGLCDQARRAAVSVPANIAEGHGRQTTKDFLRFVSIAMGSLAELETYLLLSVELGYCSAEDVGGPMRGCDGEGRMLRGLQKSLRSRLKPPSP